MSFRENKVFLNKFKKLINSKSHDAKKVIQPTSSPLLATVDKTKCEYTQLSYVKTNIRETSVFAHICHNVGLFRSNSIPSSYSSTYLTLQEAMLRDHLGLH